MQINYFPSLFVFASLPLFPQLSMHPYVQFLAGQLSRPLPPSVLKEAIQRPLLDSGLMTALSRDRLSFSHTNTTLPSEAVRISTLIAGLWGQYGASEFPAALESCISAISAIGTLIKNSEDDSGSLVHALNVVTGVGRKIISHLLSSIRIRSAQTLLDSLRVEYAHLRRDAKTVPAKQVGMLLVLIHILRICMDDLKNPNIIESILASTAGILSQETSAVPKPIAITFHYYMAKHYMFLDNWDEAREELVTAWRLFPVGMTSTQRANAEKILFFLIPLNLVEGILPTQKIFCEYPNLAKMYRPIIQAVKSGDVKQYRQLVESDLVLRNSLFFLLNRIELLVHRRCAQKIFQITQNRKIDFDMYSEISGEPADVFAILILEKLISGYISYEEQALLLTGNNPFRVME
jgi:hypothetical protein